VINRFSFSLLVLSIYHPGIESIELYQPVYQFEKLIASKNPTNDANTPHTHNTAYSPHSSRGSHSRHSPHTAHTYTHNRTKSTHTTHNPHNSTLCFSPTLRRSPQGPHGPGPQNPHGSQGSQGFQGPIWGFYADLPPAERFVNYTSVTAKDRQAAHQLGMYHNNRHNYTEYTH
jgi:hypothetical protein